jgi:Methyltransferase domain
MGSVTAITAADVAERLGVDPSGYKVEVPNMDRRDLAALFGELGYTKGVEVGVEQGVYSKMMLTRNDALHLWSVDAWTPYSGYRDHVTQEKMDSLRTIAHDRLSPFFDRCSIVQKFSVEASRDFPDDFFDFAYIDANHELSHVIADLTAWAPKVRRGGIVAGHDYISRVENGYLMHVVEAVHAYVQSWQIRPLFIVGSKEIREGEKRDRPRSWFWVVDR